MKKNKQDQTVTKGNGRVLVKRLNDNDVLQGRGSGSMQNTGNIKFRNLVEKLRPAYVATSSRKEKAKMISDMVKLIQSRNGRFLQRLGDKEVEELGLDPQNSEHPGEQDHYVEMTDEEAAEKAKQAIRYVHYKKVPLEAERQKKRAADSNFLAGDDKADHEITHGAAFGGNPLASASLSALAQSQVAQPNVLAGAAFKSQLPKPDVNQLLSSFQTAQSALAAQLSAGNDLNAVQAAVQQSSLLRDQANGVIPLLGNVQQPNPLQRLGTLPTTSNQNANQAQVPKQQQPQLNVLLQSIIQQQANLQQNSILQTILQAQQQHEQKQLNSALQSLQQQQQLATAIQSLQQPNQQQLQQQKANAILASLLSASNGNPALGSGLNPSTGQPVPAGIGTANALLASMLSNNSAPAVALQQAGNPLSSMNPIQQQNQGITGGNIVAALPGSLPAANSIATNTNDNTAKRQKLS